MLGDARRGEGLIDEYPGDICTQSESGAFETGGTWTERHVYSLSL